MPAATIRRLSVRPWMVAAGLCALFLAVILVHYHAGAREFLWPTMTGQAGYDGQFTYAIALDPANAAPHLDAPAYRYQRILHPLFNAILVLLINYLTLSRSDCCIYLQFLLILTII